MRWLSGSDFLASGGLLDRGFGRVASPRRKWLYAMLLLAGWLGLATLAWRAAGLARASTGLQQELDARMARAATHQPAAPSLPADQRQAIAGIVARLNVDWAAVLDELERLMPPDIAVIEIEPRPTQSMLTLTVEAPTAEAALACLKALNTSPRFADGRVLKHDVNDRNGGRPLRFVLALRLREGSR